MWLASKGEKTEVQESSEKGKQKEERIARSKGENNGMESMEEGSNSFSPVTYSVSTGIL